VNELVARRRPQLLAASLCAGLALPNVLRVHAREALVLTGLAAVASFCIARPGPVAVALALFVGGAWWGSARLDVLDRSELAADIGRAARTLVAVTGPPRAGRFEIRTDAEVRRFDGREVHESVLLELPNGRAPPEGAVLDGIGNLTAPHGPEHGFDERAWLRRKGVHVVVRLSSFRIVGRRGGLGGFTDSLRRRLRHSVVRGLRGERAALLEGVVLGDDGGLSREVRDRFRAAGLYHLLAVSGQNVALVGGGVMILAWVLGLSRVIGQLGALAAIVAYVLAVGAQPSVIRAGVAGSLAIVAWLTSRIADRWHLLLVGAIVLLAWNPYTLLDAGFQLSFAAVIAIFVLVPRLERVLEGYPLGDGLRTVVAVSAACGFATAPILWLQFHAVQLLSIPANALAAPAVVPLLGLALASVAVDPFSGSAAAALAWLNGWTAAYLVAVARLVGGLPFAQISSTRALLAVLAGALLVAAYACGRGGDRAQARLPDYRGRPAEDPARPQTAPRPDRR
jgi:competence protein ComEC